ncbi:carboxyltransferase domain-containing protein [Pseudomonas sp. MWU16-30317]|uniref:5-oxoprolinase subunit B family protein n=1 Tax=Pseudomonas sp. MWU16-30317 TaxID=2878095 RepID=UPI001CFB9C2C|nr:carboxyltransferase domain-containing protein [Pseudomonas sp. MWU16-30317]
MTRFTYARTRAGQLETVAVDCVMIRLFERIEEDNVPWLLAAAARLRAAFGERLIDLVPSYTTLMLHYDLQQLAPRDAAALIIDALADLTPDSQIAGQCHELPVWYDPSVGPELQRLASAGAFGIDEVIRRHCAKAYQVFALGFTPGFAFMGLVEPALATPRLSTPRQKIMAGSVGIGERQTAIYPSISPGGWNILGRCPTPLFDREREGFALMQPGDTVRFVAIDKAEFIHLGGDDTPQESAA